MRIYTLTLSPAYDVHAHAREFEAYHENIATVQTRDAGGKGLNISRALHNSGVDNTALIVLGRENSGDFKKELSRIGLNCVLFECDGRIRENLTLHCDTAPETRISFTGFRLDSKFLWDIRDRISADADTVVTFTGRVPDGISMTDVKAFLTGLKEMGSKIVVDSRSFTLKDLYDVKPWLIKPNQEEISQFFGCAVQGLEQTVEKARELASNGIENAMISLGGDGAVLVSHAGVFHATVPQISVVSTIGAGDSSIAGFLEAAGRGCTPQECLKTAVSFGTAACLTSGTMPPDKHEIQKIYRKVSIETML